MKTLLLDKKIIVLFIAFIILFPIGIFGLRLNTPSQQEKQTETAPIIHEQETTPTSSVLPETDPQKRLLDYIQNRRPLTEADLKAKTSLIDIHNQTGSGVVYQNERLSIEYVKSADLLQVEIRTKAIDAAKDEALLWLKSKGLSDEGICNLPVSFYLNFDIKTELGVEADTFNPLPETC